MSCRKSLKEKKDGGERGGQEQGGWKMGEREDRGEEEQYV